jgi:SAM-dependent methyltransferase
MSDKLFLAKDAHKLDAPERKTWLPPAQVLEALGLRPGMVIADIGAGTGYFTIPIADSPAGVEHIYAFDMQPEMLAILKPACRALMPQRSPCSKARPTRLASPQGPAISPCSPTSGTKWRTGSPSSRVPSNHPVRRPGRNPRLA